jgi:hypothetical protein
MGFPAFHSRYAGRGKPARGAREIHGHPREIHGIAVAPDLIGTITRHFRPFDKLLRRRRHRRQ